MAAGDGLATGHACGRQPPYHPTSAFFWLSNSACLVGLLLAVNPHAGGRACLYTRSHWQAALSRRDTARARAYTGRRGSDRPGTRMPGAPRTEARSAALELRVDLHQGPLVSNKRPRKRTEGLSYLNETAYVTRRTFIYCLQWFRLHIRRMCLERVRHLVSPYIRWWSPRLHLVDSGSKCGRPSNQPSDGADHSGFTEWTVK